MGRDNQDRVEAVDLRAMLWDVAYHRRGSRYATYVLEEMPYLKRAPPEWEAVVVEASSWDGVDSPEEFGYACLEFLLTQRSRWPGWSGGVCRLLQHGVSYVNLCVAAEYVALHGGVVPPDLAREVRRAYAVMPRWRAVLYQFDGPLRKLRAASGA